MLYFKGKKKTKKAFNNLFKRWPNKKHFLKYFK